MVRAKALYDFSGEPNTAEMSITSGEILTILRQDVGEGWWEGRNAIGKEGLFPAAYVELIQESAQAPAPPVPPVSYPPPQIPAPKYEGAADDWTDQQDDWDDDWDDDNEETYAEIGPGSNAANNNGTYMNTAAIQAARQQQQRQQNYNNMSLPPPPPTDDTVSIASAATNAPTIKKSGLFQKANDNYILGQSNPTVPDNEKVYIYQSENGYYWHSTVSPYTVTVASPKKETKFKGIKSFIAYQLTPSFNNIPVSRRYKHFDWLHERLVEKYYLIPIPPLPDKQISGRYEESFVEHRRVQLQEFVDWMCRHPVLSASEVWMHFLTCNDEKRWKTGKRSAERDNLTGLLYCAAICPPEKQLLASQVDPLFENSNNFVHSMDAAVKTLFAIANEQAKRYQIQMKKDYQRVGEGLSDMAKALLKDERPETATGVCLSNSVGQAAGVFIGLAQVFGEQPKRDWIPFSDRLHIYRGILNTFPEVIGVQKYATQKKRECERRVGDQKMPNAQLHEVNRRVDVISYAVLAELTHFRSERDVHLKETMRNFITAQIGFYQDIISRLQVAQKFFE